MLTNEPRRIKRDALLLEVLSTRMRFARFVRVSLRVLETTTLPRPDVNRRPPEASKDAPTCAVIVAGRRLFKVMIKE